MHHGTGVTTQRPRCVARVIALVLLLLAPRVATAAEHAAAPPDLGPAPTVEAFTAVRLVDPTPPAYPGMARIRAREGWVLLHCVVDASGVLTDVTVRDSTGQPEFEAAAVKWMRGNRFEPARLGERTVQSAFPYKVTFMMQGEERGARAAFVRTYRRFQDAIEAKDRAAAEAALAELDVVNLYEDAYFHMAKYWHATLWGDEAQRTSELLAAIANEKHARFLPRSTFYGAARALFGLQLAQNDFGAALATYGLLPPSVQGEPGVARVAEDLRALATDARAFRVRGEIGARGFWTTWLLKRRFRIEPGTGEVPEFRLHCERHYVIVRLDPALDYTRNEDAGNCQIELVGTRGSTFTLLQM